MPNDSSPESQVIQPVLPLSSPAVSLTSAREEGMLRTICALQQEVKNLRDNGVVKTITREVCPPDYQELKQTNKLLKDDNQRLRRIIEAGHITFLANMIDEYISQSQKQIQPITQEILLSSYDKDDVHKVQELVNYLQNLQQELRALLTIQEDGIASSESFAKRQVQNDIRQFVERVSNSNTLQSLTEAQMLELHQIFLELKATLSQFFQQSKRKE